MVLGLNGRWMGDDLSFYTPEQLFQLQESGKLKIQTESQKQDENTTDIEDWSDKTDKTCEEKKKVQPHSKPENHTKKFYETFHNDDLYYYDSKFGDCFEIDQGELEDHDDPKDTDYKDISDSRKKQSTKSKQKHKQKS